MSIMTPEAIKDAYHSMLRRNALQTQIKAVKNLHAFCLEIENVYQDAAMLDAIQDAVVAELERRIKNENKLLAQLDIEIRD